MVEVTGFREAKTIHRLLEFNKIGFQRNEENPLSEDIIIIDEASMINAFLFNSLLKAVKPYAKIIIVFDHGQLPPIGVGNVATDLLSSTVLPVIRLNTVHRQAQKSGILMDANNIRENKSPFANLQVNMTTGELKDMHYMFRNDQEQLNSIALSLFYKLLDNGYSLDDIAIIVPRKAKCINSCFAINKEIQSKLLKNEVRFILKEEEKIYLGAKLIQRKNDYEKNVVNGEIGYLTNIKEDGSFEITFDSDKIVGYKKFETADLDLAYAITIHSSQGGQYKKVIVVLDQSHYILLDACLLYTAMTRAIEECWVISEVESFTKCVTENKNEKRQTYLCQLIKEYEELNEKLNKLNTID
jgi:exodeoxyribonuclease V alpha subunit